MNTILFLVMRRMRLPLLVLLGAYAVSILGMTLVDGGDGRPMDFFHAFYFVSYTATTIGFGEIPQEFTDAQRMWVTVSIYLTVVAWFYGIGAILALVQEPGFRRAVVEARFSRSVKYLREPFYLVCGFGDTGKALVRALTERQMGAVVIDIRREAIDELSLKDYLVSVPGLCADARTPLHLLEGGLKHPRCAGVVAVTNDEHANLTVAIASKLLHPEVPVICRGESQDYEANMASFGTDYIIDPYKVFAERLGMVIRTPGLFVLYDWLTGVPDRLLSEPLYPPQGTWILCGFGRFGKAVHARLAAQGLSTVVVEERPEGLGCPPGTVTGRGTEAVTLNEAGIHDAMGIVAGTRTDANNLSIVMTAREMKSDLFVVIRQNQHHNTPLFEAIGADLVMHPSEIIARAIRVLLTQPLLKDFIKATGRESNEWANTTVSRVLGVVGETVPDVWSVDLRNRETTEAVSAALGRGRSVLLEDILRDPRARETHLSCVALMLWRRGRPQLLPDGDLALEPGDRLLFCGADGVAARMSWTLRNDNALSYVMTGEEAPDGHVWRWARALLKAR